MLSSGPTVFQRFGRSYHLKISSAADLAMAMELDEALWVATGAPIGAMSCDRTFLSLLDTDRNGRVMCFELRDAIEWTLDIFSDTSGLDTSSTTLKLSSINTDNEQGQRVHASASRMLMRLASAGDSQSDEITLEQVRAIKAEVEANPVSEAGVVLPEAGPSEKVRAFLSDIINSVGPVEHPSGCGGVSQRSLDSFLTQAEARLDWLARSQSQSDVMPLAEKTPQAYAAVAGMAAKIDQFFMQCEAVALDSGMADRIMATATKAEGVDMSDADAIRQLISEAPLARCNAAGLLPLEGEVNPLYAASLAKLRSVALQPVLGEMPTELTARQWRQVKSFFAAHKDWIESQAGKALNSIDSDNLREYLQPQLRQAVESLIAERVSTAFVMDNIRLTEKLILYQANLMNLANNFVSFPNLYDIDKRAMFEMGTLVMDGRQFNFSVNVTSRSEHAAVAKTGNMFVMYVEITPAGGADKYEVAVPVTSGGRGNICVGKRGVFRDVHGLQHDARVVQIIENPISVSEAVLSPFKRLGAMLTGKVEAIASASQKEFETSASRALSTDASAGKAPPAKPQGSQGLLAGGLLMGGGVALAAIGSALAYAADKLKTVPDWKIAATIVVVILAVVLPISLLSLIKLRKRDLSAILEGSAWAINARMRLTLRQGRFFTRRPGYPADARGTPSLRCWILLGVFILIAGAAIVVWRIWLTA